jgi:ribosomal protein S18 acetylase RimI-like enzyme
MAIEYDSEISGIRAAMLDGGFFEGWPNPPSPATHLRILRGSAHVVMAIDTETEQVIGFINAISDGVHAAFIPLLEVLPSYRGRGIGRELVRRMLGLLDGHYSIDLMCDPDVQGYYESLGGWTRTTGMSIRDYDRQAGGMDAVDR